MNAAAKARMNRLANKFRSGKPLTPSEDSELSALEAEFALGYPPPQKVRSVWDLPVAKACFEADSQA